MRNMRVGTWPRPRTHYLGYVTMADSDLSLSKEKVSFFFNTILENFFIENKITSA